MTVKIEASNGRIGNVAIDDRPTGHIEGIPGSLSVDLRQGKANTVTARNDDKGQLDLARAELPEGGLNGGHLHLGNLLQLTVTGAQAKEDQTVGVVALALFEGVHQCFSHVGRTGEDFAPDGRLRGDRAGVVAHVRVAGAHGGGHGDVHLVTGQVRMAQVHAHHHRAASVNRKVPNVIWLDDGVLRKKRRGQKEGSTYI